MKLKGLKHLQKDHAVDMTKIMRFLKIRMPVTRVIFYVNRTKGFDLNSDIFALSYVPAFEQ